MNYFFTTSKGLFLTDSYTKEEVKKGILRKHIVSDLKRSDIVEDIKVFNAKGDVIDIIHASELSKV